jgi:excinuclease ABC subunit B
LNGTAILYADRMTGSMSRAIEETNRRREKQTAYNVEHGITPTSISKAVHDIMEGAYPSDPNVILDHANAELAQASYSEMSHEQLAKILKKLEKKMLQHAKSLEFEAAAQVRDEISQLKKAAFGL